MGLCSFEIIELRMPTEVTKSFFEVPPKPFNRWDYLLCVVVYLLIAIAFVPGIPALIVSLLRSHRLL
jgi:hypothetical protein